MFPTPQLQVRFPGMLMLEGIAFAEHGVGKLGEKNPNPARQHSHSRRAFTLIELILVMILLLGAVALVTPKLAGFFNGRKVDSEARRILSLTRYGQNRAVAEGIPMVLWINSQAGSYGLRQENGYADSDPKQITYTVAEDVKISFDRGTSKPPIGNQTTGIHFSPDGTVNTTTSVRGISVQEGKSPAQWVVPSSTWMVYEIRSNRNR